MGMVCRRLPCLIQRIIHVKMSRCAPERCVFRLTGGRILLFLRSIRAQQVAKRPSISWVRRQPLLFVRIFIGGVIDLAKCLSITVRFRVQGPR